MTVRRAIDLPCKHCGAEGGRPCHTLTGRRPGTETSHTHRARTAAYADWRRLVDQRAALVDALTRCDPLAPDAESEAALRALEAFDAAHPEVRAE